MNAGEIARISGDPDQLRAMIMRFAENAREALPAGGGTIEFTTQTDARDWVVLTIRDSGCGMSQEVQRRATEPFFSTKDEHAGVGLTIAQVIWRRHRGALFDREPAGRGDDGAAIGLAAACGERLRGQGESARAPRRDRLHDRHHRLRNGEFEKCSKGDRGGWKRRP